MKEETVVVLNTYTNEVGEIRRRLFESPVFNPDGLLVEIEDTRSGCVDCGIEPAECEEECEDDLPELTEIEQEED